MFVAGRISRKIMIGFTLFRLKWLINEEYDLDYPDA